MLFVAKHLERNRGPCRERRRDVVFLVKGKASAIRGPEARVSSRRGRLTLFWNASITGLASDRAQA